VIDEAAVRAWVDGYERAWRTAGTDGLATLFSSGATYQQAPFMEPVRGLEAIEVLWDAEREGHDEPFAMTAEVVAVTHPRAVVRVEVRYGKPGGVHYKDLWVLELGDDGRCVAFEEWPFWPDGPGATPDRGGSGSSP
jgi:hypothetical protein